MRGENFVAHLDGLGGTPMCRGTPVAHHCSIPVTSSQYSVIHFQNRMPQEQLCFFEHHYYFNITKLPNLPTKLRSSSYRHVILTNSMKKSPILESDGGLAGEETPCFKWKPKVNYYVHKARPWNVS
jgi:hypothetical protein